jgi:hypothetical protein
MTDIHPSVEEIKPYVAVGPTKDLSVTVHKKTFDSAFIAATIIFGIILLALIGFTIFAAYRQSRLQTPPTAPLETVTLASSLHTNLGASSHGATPIAKTGQIAPDASDLTTQSQCESNPHAIWIENKCDCLSPFFGPTCSRERHDKKYFAVGIPKIKNSRLNVDIINTVTSNGKSFNSNGVKGSCSDVCNKTDKCTGFIYQDPGTCTLLSGDIIIPEESTILYSHDVDATLYLKSSDNLHFQDRIFLSVYSWTIPPRYWLVDETKYYRQLYPNIIVSLSFVPGYSKIYGSYTGIYCRHPFTVDDIDILIQRGENSQCYIHRPNTQINIPIDFQYKTPLYVVYVPLDI